MRKQKWVKPERLKEEPKQKQPAELPEMSAADAALILSKRAAYLKQVAETIDQDDTRKFAAALTLGARALLRECGVDAFDDP